MKKSPTYAVASKPTLCFWPEPTQNDTMFFFLLIFRPHFELFFLYYLNGIGFSNWAAECVSIDRMFCLSGCDLCIEFSGN